LLVDEWELLVESGEFEDALDGRRAGDDHESDVLGL
jgi:hypothetical protein